MSCGCGGGRGAPPYHPSDSYHFQGGGGIGSPPALDPGDEIPIVPSGPGPESMAQPDRAPGDAAGAGGETSIVGWVIVGVLVFALYKAVT